ncbi:hypothetical protein [Streptomyces chartreusis]|uniref:hypothetical protein n=1 Tax=Streptomyces chartreusis TaxID=1969 RepID=UPI003679C912
MPDAAQEAEQLGAVDGVAQFAGTRVAGGEIHRGKRAIVDAQRRLVAVEDIMHVEAAGRSQEHAELRALEWVEAAEGAGVLLKDGRVIDACLLQDEVLPGGESVEIRL